MWELAYHSGISRRRYLKLLAVGGAAAVLAACSGQKLSPGTTGPPYFKDPAPFIQRKLGLEARLENMSNVVTPNRFFFVRNNSRSMDLDADTWRLSPFAFEDTPAALGAIYTRSTWGKVIVQR